MGKEGGLIKRAQRGVARLLAVDLPRLNATPIIHFHPHQGNYEYYIMSHLFFYAWHIHFLRYLISGLTVKSCRSLARLLALSRSFCLLKCDAHKSPEHGAHALPRLALPRLA